MGNWSFTDCALGRQQRARGAVTEPTLRIQPVHKGCSRVVVLHVSMPSAAGMGRGVSDTKEGPQVKRYRFG